MSADITTGAATGATFAFPRHEQTFPTLTHHEIERMRRFGELRTYKDGEALFETGKPGPGMFVVLSGHVAINLRDGLGHVTPVIDQGAGQFVAEIGQLSGRVALVDGHADGDVETLLLPAGSVTRAVDGRGLPRPPQHPAHGAIHRVVAGQVQGLLEMTDYV